MSIEGREPEKFLLVVSIFEGKKFPLRADHALVVEAKFDGELMSTDPVPHVNEPVINAELAWEIDRKTLSLHRLQRSSVRLHCFAVGVEGQRKEIIGHIILSVRLFHESAQHADWHPVLNSKYKVRPELLISLYLEKYAPLQPDSSVKDPAVSAKGQSTEANHRDSDLDANIHKNSSETQENILTPVLFEEEGFYCIGQNDENNERFILSVTVPFAANLIQLLPSAMKIPMESREFYFFYSLLGNEVKTEPFVDLLHPEFAAERASVRICSSRLNLMSFLERSPGLKVVLYCNDAILGYGNVPLASLLKSDASEPQALPASIEGTFVLLTVGSEMDIVQESDSQPVVGVSVTLRHDDEVENLKDLKVLPVDTKPGTTSIPPVKADELPTVPNDYITLSDTEDPPLKEKGSEKVLYSNSPPQKLDSLTQLYDSDRNVKSQLDTKSHKELPLPGGSSSLAYGGMVTNIPQEFGSKSQLGILSESKGDERRNDVASLQVGSTIRFCFTLDIRSVRITAEVPHVDCYFRYSYPFFGTSAAIRTHPSIPLRPNMDVTIPHGYCTFNFATGAEDLKKSFKEVPVLVEMVQPLENANKDINRDEILATTYIQLHYVLNAMPQIYPKDDGTSVICRISTCQVHLINTLGKTIGELHAVMKLEDLGPLHPGASGLSSLPEPKAAPHGTGTSLPDHPLPQNMNVLPKFKVKSALTDDELMQAAFELEVWKEQQEVLFRDELKMKEKEHLQALSTEWKRRDIERELIMQRRVQESQQLESKLRAALVDIETRERSLASSETELEKKMSDLQIQKERMQLETKDIIRRIKLDHEHQLQLERKKSQELVADKQKAQNQIKDLEKKLKERDREIESLRRSQAARPEFKLKSEIDILKMEKAEIQKKLESAISSKQQYKQQWGQALNEISLLHNQIFEIQKAELYHQKRELEGANHLKIREAIPESFQPGTRIPFEGKTVSKEATAPVSRSAPLTSTASGDHIHGAHKPTSAGTHRSNAPAQEEWVDRVQRLIEERDTMLNTGVYKDTDKIIVELNRHIKEAMLSSRRLDAHTER